MDCIYKYWFYLKRVIIDRVKIIDDFVNMFKLIYVKGVLNILINIMILWFI